jgi:hypothetical protein
MSTLLALIGALWARIAAVAVKIGLPAALAFLNPLTPIVTGIGNFIGAIVTAVGEILAALSKSAEGRVALCLIAALAGFLYLRFHYIQEGKAIERAKIATAHKPCPASRVERRSR